MKIQRSLFHYRLIVSLWIDFEWQKLLINENPFQAKRQLFADHSRVGELSFFACSAALELHEMHLSSKLTKKMKNELIKDEINEQIN